MTDLSPEDTKAALTLGQEVTGHDDQIAEELLASAVDDLAGNDDNADAYLTPDELVDIEVDDE